MFGCPSSMVLTSVVPDRAHPKTKIGRAAAASASDMREVGPQTELEVRPERSKVLHVGGIVLDQCVAVLGSQLDLRDARRVATTGQHVGGNRERLQPEEGVRLGEVPSRITCARFELKHEDTFARVALVDVLELCRVLPGVKRAHMRLAVRLATLAGGERDGGDVA